MTNEEFRKQIIKTMALYEQMVPPPRVLYVPEKMYVQAIQSAIKPYEIIIMQSHCS
jgi:hypothetical protein